MKLAIGIMSGTSLDGVDVVLVQIKENFKDTKVKIVDFKTYPIEKEIKRRIISQLNLNTSNVKEITSLNFEISEMFARQTKSLLEANGLTSEDISFVASHGQTIYHLPKETGDLRPSTLQLGDGSVLANNLNITTISNFRTADMAVGGQGAPLVPYADYCLYSSDKVERIMLNIGGIANVTYLKKGGSLDDVIAFDTGPGNMIINYFMEKLYDLPYDNNGDIAKKGELIKPLFEELVNNEYFKLPYPKSTGREDFGSSFSEEILNKYKNEKKEDLIATATHFTAKTISMGCKLICDKLEGFELIASGGGAHNAYLLKLLSEYLKEVKVTTTSFYGLNVDAKEALAFVILGNETLSGKSSNVKSATGAKKDVILGQISNVITK